MHTFHTLVPHNHTHVWGCLLRKSLTTLPLESIPLLRGVGSPLVAVTAFSPPQDFPLQGENLDRAVASLCV